MPDHVVRVAALGDLHCTKTSQGVFQPLFARIAQSAEVLLLAGDLTDYGLPDEARVLARLRTSQLVALLHYSPVQDTVDGEPPEIFPFIGSSRLEEPIDRYPVSFVIHGHAHRGKLEGATRSGVPVYNVSLPLLTRSFPDRPTFRIFDVEVSARDTSENPLAHAPASASAGRAPHTYAIAPNTMPRTSGSRSFTHV